MLGIVGDFDNDQMLELVKRSFGDWAPAAGQPPQPPTLPTEVLPPQDAVRGKVFLVDRPGLTQVREKLLLSSRISGGCFDFTVSRQDVAESSGFVLPVFRKLIRGI